MGCGSSNGKVKETKHKEKEQEKKIETQTDRDYYDIKEVFDSWDKDKSGKIDRKEMSKVMKELGNDLSTEQCIKAIEVFDQDNDGQINFNEFMVLIKKGDQIVSAQNQFDEEGDTTNDNGLYLTIEQKKQMHQKFMCFDKNGNGQIDNRELKAVLKDMNPNLTDIDIEELLIDYDKDDDSQINFVEFCNLLQDGKIMLM